MNAIIPNTIISLDLSYNNFENIVMIINVLSQIKNLKILSFIVSNYKILIETLFHFINFK